MIATAEPDLRVTPLDPRLQPIAAKVAGGIRPKAAGG